MNIDNGNVDQITFIIDLEMQECNKNDLFEKQTKISAKKGNLKKRSSR